MTDDTIYLAPTLALPLLPRNDLPAWADGWNAARNYLIQQMRDQKWPIEQASQSGSIEDAETTEVAVPHSVMVSQIEAAVEACARVILRDKHSPIHNVLECKCNECGLRRDIAADIRKRGKQE